MADAAKIPDSLQEQIIQQMLAAVREHNEFDDELVAKLSQLAKKGDLKKPQQVTAAIKAIPGGSNETSRT